MNRVLVVGGAGYVGSVLVEELLARGYSVRVFDRLYFGDVGMRHVRDRIDLVVGDMRVMDPAVLHGVQAVVNVGGLSNDPTAEYNPQANVEMNTTATLSLAEMARSGRVSRYVFASSASIYDVGVSDHYRDVVLDEDAVVAPRAAYSSSKYEAERGLLGMAGPDFCPVVLRKGTIYGWSPRMRYDLVMNTFVKDAISTGRITIHYGGEMWRPLIDVRDVARAYIAAIEAPDSVVRGQIFNVVYRNFRISELAIRVREALRALGMEVDVFPDFGYKGVRSYRISGEKAERVLNIKPQIGVEESVAHLVQQIRAHGVTDWDNPRYYNIRWMKQLEEAESILGITGSTFGAPARVEARSPEVRPISTRRASGA
jgi:nucleoside-diphosphate-sugar epimerase